MLQDSQVLTACQKYSIEFNIFALVSQGGEGWMPVAGKEGRLEVMGATFSPAKWGRQGGAQILGSKARPESLSNLVFRRYIHI